MLLTSCIQSTNAPNRSSGPNPANAPATYSSSTSSWSKTSTTTLVSQTITTSGSPNETPSLVEFHIPEGTGQGPWNSSSNPLLIKIPPSGRVTLRIINDDSTSHVLHTNGRPCPHGNVFSPMKKGGVMNCVIDAPFDASTSGELHDHNVGEAAGFYMKASY
jgi:hypothetical protein